MKNFFSIFFVLLGALFFLSLAKHVTYATDCTSVNSFCSLTQPATNPVPGATCPEGNGNYVYGSSGNCGPGQNTTCVPRCGTVGNGWCCDPKPGYFPKNSLPGCTTLTKDGGCATVNTALGPIATDPSGIAGSVLGILLSVAGGIAILLIVASGYQMVMSQGNPEKVKAARERLTSAIVGLLFIIFSVAILQFIGFTILHLPGFSNK